MAGQPTVKTLAAITRPGRYRAGGPGLLLQIGPTGKRSWVFRFQRAKRVRDMGLGACTTVTLHEARELAHQCRRLLQRGIDPLEHRRAHALHSTAPSFRAFVAEFVKLQSPGWRNPKTAAQFERVLKRHAYRIIGDLPVDAIAVDHLMKILSLIWSTIPVMAEHVRSNIAAVLDAAKARGLRQGDNPAAWRGALSHLLPRAEKIRRPKHHAAMAWKDLPAFIAHLHHQKTLSARALEFTILTAARTSETIGATWDEISGRTWSVAASRMKSARDHRVPLAPAAIALLAMLPRGEDNAHLFVGHRRGKGMSNMSMLKLLRSLEPGVTVHGFRSSFRTWAADHGVRRELAELALSHSIAGATEAAYLRTDQLEERRKLMVKWAKFVGGKS